MPLYFVPMPPRDYVEYRCPNGHVVAREPDCAVLLGSRMRTCRRCGLEVAVPAYREWADMTAPQRRDVRIGFALATVFTGGALGVLAGAAAVIAGLFAGLPDAALIVVLAAGIALGPAIVALACANMIRASLRRSAASGPRAM